MKNKMKMRAFMASEYVSRDTKREKTKARDKARRDKKATRQKFSQ